MGGQRAAELPNMAATPKEDGRAGPQPRQSDGADGARSEHGALARRKYKKLASEATEGGQANAGTAGVEDGHGASANRKVTGTEEEGDKTPQRALPAQNIDRGETEASPPPKRSRTLNASGLRGGGGHPAEHAHSVQRGHGVRPPNTSAQDPPCDRAQDEEGGPQPQQRVQPSRKKEGG